MESITLKINHKDHSEVELINPKGEKFIFNPNIHEGFADFLHCAETIKSDNTETLANALHEIEKLEADKAQLVEMMEKVIVIQDKYFGEQEIHNRLRALCVQIESLIQKHKQ